MVHIKKVFAIIIVDGLFSCLCCSISVLESNLTVMEKEHISGDHWL